MNCNEACDFLVSAQEDRTAAMSRDFDAHVRSCPSCAKMAAISEVRRELVGASTDKIVTVPPFFSARVMAAIAEQKAEAETRAFEPWAWIWQMARRMVPAGVGLAVLIAVFTFGFTPSPTPIVDTVDNSPTVAGQYDGLDGLPQDGQNAIMFTPNADLSADTVLSTVLGPAGRLSND
jgi:hypothetical protein